MIKIAFEYLCLPMIATAIISAVVWAFKKH